MSRLLLPVVAALLIVLGAPFLGQLRGFIQASLPGQYRLIIIAIVAAGVIAALGSAILRIRERRPARYGALAAAVVVGVLYALATATGNPDVDAVERFHFVEFGLLTFLFHRAWRDPADVAALVLPAVATMLAAIADEWMQWFVPYRVGELHDVALNAAAVACGLLFSIGVDTRPPLEARLSSDRRRRLGAGVAILVLTLAGFIDVVHLGFSVSEPGTGRFLSQWSRDGLDRARDSRTRLWAGRVPVDPPRLSGEDHYIAEAMWHVVARNDAVAAHDAATAWLENSILERFFTPVLDATGLRWPSEQRAQAETLASTMPPAMVSTANAVPVYTIDRRLFWLGALLVAGMVMLWTLRSSRRPGSASTTSTARSTI